MAIGLEIERRFLIERPDVQLLAERYGAKVKSISQTYLMTSDGYSSERVRCMTDRGGRVYTHTKKRRISRESAIEEERELSEAEYRTLLLSADPTRRVIEKDRVTFFFGGQCYEIDLYPFFSRIAVLETELPRADAPVAFPPELVIIREVTGIRSLSNHALALCVPDEASLLE
jgi:CYTH domain-containing protein